MDREIKTEILEDVLGNIEKKDSKTDMTDITSVEDSLPVIDEDYEPADEPEIILEATQIDFSEDISENENTEEPEIQIFRFEDNEQDTGDEIKIEIKPDDKEVVPELQEFPEFPEFPEIQELHKQDLNIAAYGLPDLPELPEIPKPHNKIPEFKERNIEPELNVIQEKNNVEILNQHEELERRIIELETENKKYQITVEQQKKEINEFTSKLGTAEAENKKLKAEISNSAENTKMEYEVQINKANIIEEKYEKLSTRHEELKAKVRRDIRKIKFREKELAHKLELIKQDSETLLSSKDHKILQLKRHIDSLDFEIETLKDRIDYLQELVKDNEEKAERVVKALRLSTSLLESNSKKS